MASVEKRGKDDRGRQRYRVRYRDPLGQGRSRTFHRKPDAERFRATVEADKARGDWIDPKLGRTMFRDVAASWLEHRVNLKPKTLAGYRSLLDTLLLPAFGDRAVGKLRPHDVERFIARETRRGLSASRVRQAYTLLGAILKGAVRDGYIASNPCEGVKPPKLPRGDMRFLSAPEVERLAEAMPAPYDVLVLVLAYGGIRWGEACALRRRHVDISRCRLHVAESLSDVNGEVTFGPTKTDVVRDVVLPGFACDRLAEHLATVDDDADALLFRARRGGPLRHSSFHKLWQQVTREAGFDGLRIHDLRHTCASLLIQRGAHPKVMMTHLGHSSITVTLDRYGHLYPDDLDRLWS